MAWPRRQVGVGLGSRPLDGPTVLPFRPESHHNPSLSHGILIVDTREVGTKTRVQRWGNSLAVRIPKAFAAEVGLADGTPVEIKVSRGALVVEPSNTAPSLVELLSGISKANLHGESDTGRPVGNEVW